MSNTILDPNASQTTALLIISFVKVSELDPFLDYLDYLDAYYTPLKKLVQVWIRIQNHKPRGIYDRQYKLVPSLDQQIQPYQKSIGYRHL